MTDRHCVLVDGSPQGAIPADDRGLAYGDGLFETLAVWQGKALAWDAHLARLQHGCERLAIPMPDADLLRREAARLLAGRPQRAVLKLILTRGSGARGYDPATDGVARRIWRLLPWPEHSMPATGARLHTCALRWSSQPRLAGIKHLNRLEQVLAAAELAAADADEGLLLDEHDRVISGIRSNVFMARGGVLATPPVSRCGVAGVVRGLILGYAPQWNLLCEERPLTQADLIAADEIFLTNSLLGVRPVAALDGRTLAAGPLAAWLRAALVAQGDLVPEHG